MKEYQAGILAEYVPYTPHTAQNLKKLAELKPKTLAIMDGSSFTGDCARALDNSMRCYGRCLARRTRYGDRSSIDLATDSSFVHLNLFW